VLHSRRWSIGFSFGLAALACSEATAPNGSPAIKLLAISAGAFHACGITPGDSTVCWGSTALGVSGTLATRPVVVTTLPGATAIAAGGTNACALAAGRLYCWGQLTEVNSAPSWRRTLPDTVPGGAVFGNVTTSLHDCALAVTGAAYCWGQNDNGELGIGSLATSFDSTPLAVAGGITFASVSAGPWHSCGLTAGGQAYCWGDNQVGELGDTSAAMDSTCGYFANRLCAPTPVPVQGGLQFRSVAAGGLFSCGVTIAGKGYCWGWNPEGSLGTPFASGHCIWPTGSTPTVGDTEPCARFPIPVQLDGPGSDSLFAEISVGPGHACALTTGGRVFCWGTNYSGELGRGDTTRYGCGSETPCVPRARLVLHAPGSWVHVTAGGDFTCGLTADHTAYCWGSGGGNLGNGGTTPAYFPVAVLTPVP